MVDETGLHKTDKKVRAIKEAPHPRDVFELRSFLGLVNYYGKFLPGALTLLSPLHKLLEKNNKFEWNQECEQSFEAIKQAIASESVLVHYDPALPLQLACDASPVGIGCVLSHVLKDGTERPISFASRTLSKAERNYAQIDKEALAIVWGIKKFYMYLFGRHFTLITDHEPLTSIFHPHKSISQTAAARLQRYALFLMGFDYEIKCKKSGDHANADALSRLPVHEPLDLNDTVTNEALQVFHIEQLKTLTLSTDRVRKEIFRDPILSAVYNTVLQGWGSHSPDRALLPYFQRRHELTIQQGILMWGIRVVVPGPLQAQVLKELHAGHGGIVRMKSLARSYVWWPNVDAQIQELTKMCEGCKATQNMPRKAPLHMWERPEAPWKRVHADFAGPFLNHMFLVLQDAHSKWPEVAVMTTTTTEKTIEVMREIFARNGLPEVLVTDNGTQYTSHKFLEFTTQNGICHKFAPPFHPATNGLAERFVETLKNALKAMKGESGLTMSERVSKILMAYRNTPHTTTRETPSMLFFNRHVRTRLDLLKPREYLKKNNEAGRPRELQVGQGVLARCYMGKEKWLQGVIKSCEGPLTYTVMLKDGRLWRRHIDQLLEARESKSPDLSLSVAAEEMEVEKGVPSELNAEREFVRDEVLTETPIRDKDESPIGMEKHLQDGKEDDLKHLQDSKEDDLIGRRSGRTKRGTKRLITEI